MEIRFIKEIGRNPNIDWITTMILSVLIILILGFFDFTLYNDVRTGSIQDTGGTAGSSLTRINDKVITNVITEFGKKEERRKTAGNRYVGSGDPSVPRK